MKGKNLLAGVLSAAMVLGTMALPAFADETGTASPDWDGNSTATVFAYGANADGNFTLYADTLTDALKKVYMNAPIGTTTIECKPNANVGSMQHGHVADNLIINGNDAYVSGGEYDLEIDTYTFDRTTGTNTASTTPELSGEITVKVNKLNQIAAWGQRRSDATINLEFTDCEDMNRVYFSGNTGTTNITIKDCSFSDKTGGSSSNTSIYSNAKGEIALDNVSFANVAVPINLKNKSNGTQTIIVKNCKFTNCATAAIADNTSSALYAAPIRVVTEGSAKASNVTVENCSFTDSATAGNGTILLGDGRNGETSTPNVTLNISGTAAEIQVQEPGKRTTPTVKKTVTAADNEVVEIPAVAKINGKKYTSLKDAMQAACNMNVEDVNGVPTQTTPVTIDLVSDIENQEGFFVRGGDRGGKRNNEYGGHYNHDINITLDGHGYKIDTGVYGCENPDVKASPKIGFASLNGKFTVKDVVVPNDLVFDLSKTYDDVLSECSQREGGQACSLTIEGCTFYGSNVAYCGAVDYVTYKNNKFLLTENANNGPDSYPLWYKFNNHIKSFTVEGNTVNAERALNLARFAENSEIVVNNNNFAIANTENPAKSAAIMLAENHTASSPFTGNVTFSGNTVDAHSAVLVYAPSEYNTNFDLAAESNILANGTKLVGYNEWSGTYNDQAAKEAAETLVKKVETNANDGANVADTLKLTFKKHDDDERVYDIVLNGDGKDINRLNTVHFTFDLDNPNMTYAIKTAKGMSAIYPDNNEYVFYFDGKDAINNADTGSEITIGTVTFDGFGKFTFKATAGKATATTTADNLVTEFVTTAEAGKGALKIGEDDNMIKDAEIKVPTQKLTVNVAMEHNVGDNTEAYQDMTVAISGGDLAGKVLEYKLGDAENTAITKAMNGTMVASYQIKADLTKDRIYTVTVSGAGYRTSRYTVTMTEDKTMNFWNNDKTNEVTVIDDEKAKTTFLAGELVRDGKIDIYDLSAVVAYFGQKNIDRAQASKFAKYDLNRDGEIDIMDISIVLTSWGK